MRIAYICTDAGVPVFGTKGCSVHVQEVLRAFRKQGATIKVFATNLKGEASEDLAGIPVHRLDKPQGDRAAREQAALAGNARLRDLLQQHGPFDLVYERYALWSYSAMEYAQAQGVPGLLEVNAPLIEEQAEHRGLVDRNAAQQASRRAWHNASALLAVSHEVAEYLQHDNPAQRVHVIPNGVNPERFTPELAPALSRSEGSFVIGFVGTFKPWHGLLDLVEAFALLRPRLPQARLLLVGDGPQRETIEHDLQARGLRNVVHCTGAVSPQQIPALLTSMDVAVAPYPDLASFYFSPLKVYEYMAAGRAVVASRIGQLAQLLHDGVYALMYPPGDINALATALERLARDPELCSRLGKAARHKILREHSWDAVVQRILAIAYNSTNAQAQTCEARS